MPPVHILVFCTTEYAGRTFAPGVHLVTAAEAHSFYINGWARPATQAEIADAAASAGSTGPEAAVLSSSGEAAVVVRVRQSRTRASNLSPQLSAAS